MIKLSDYGLFDKQPRTEPKQKRRYQAARHTRQNRDWTTHPQGANWILRCDLATMRARARDMAKNSPHFRKFLSMAKANVIGHKGIQLQCDAEFATSQRPYTSLNSRVETAFWQWGKRETCTESGKLNWVQSQQLCVEMVIRDGEAIVEHIDSDNEFGYAIRFWNADWLDETHNEVLKNGNRVVMGIEIDGRDRPVAYWLSEPPSENFYGYEQANRYRRRVDARYISHIFLVTEDESQMRGMTWFHAALLQGKDLHEYTGGVVQQARVAAHTLGFLEKDVADETEFTGQEDENGNVTQIEIDVAPLSMNELPPGYKLNQFNPKQPTQNHAEFTNSMLHVLAAALGVTGFSLAGDMTQVNFSSARVGYNEEREVWRSLQEFICDTFCRDIFRRWLTNAWLKGRVEMPAEYFKQLMEPTWRPRGWAYIDPQKDVAAAVEAIGNNLLTYREHFAERGIDLEEWLQAKQKEKELFEQYDVEYEPQKALPPAPVKQAAKKTDEAAPPDDGEDTASRGYTNGRYEM